MFSQARIVFIGNLTWIYFSHWGRKACWSGLHMQEWLKKLGAIQLILVWLLIVFCFFCLVVSISDFCFLGWRFVTFTATTWAVQNALKWTISLSTSMVSATCWLASLTCCSATDYVSQQSGYRFKGHQVQKDVQPLPPHSLKESELKPAQLP